MGPCSVVFKGTLNKIEEGIMRLINIGLANINTTVGAFDSNTTKITAAAREMAKAKCTIGCFSEQVFGGYPAEDLVQWRHFVEGQWEKLKLFAATTRTFTFPTVFTVGMVVGNNGHIYNCTVIVCNGEIVGIVPKEKLPMYNVFYEERTFSPGTPGEVACVRGVPFGDLIFKFPFGTLAVETCEDLWSPDGPMRRRAYSGAEIDAIANGSPYRIGVPSTRREMITTRAADSQMTVVYVNQVGGNDSLVFDGGGFVNQNGVMLLEAERWKEGVTTQVVDLDRTVRMRSENSTWRRDCLEYCANHKLVKTISCSDGPQPNLPLYQYPVPPSKSFFLPPDTEPRSPKIELFDDLVEAMIMGLDYFEKTKAFGKIGIANSGGRDSALTLILAWLYAKRKFDPVSCTHGQRAYKRTMRDFICCFSMPTRFNSEETRSIARDMCKELGVSLKEISIEDAFEKECAAVKSMLAQGEKVTLVTVQNIQARIRGERMWNWANSTGGLWLQTGNMSERAVGYTTVGGDLMGAYSLIGNLPKTVVTELLEYLGRKWSIQSVQRLLKTEASAELGENQRDEDDLGPFPVLDACFALFAGEKLSPAELYRVVRTMWTDEELKELYPGYKPGMLKDWVKQFVRLFVSSIFKWVQAPQSVHLGSLDLDRERALQLPVVESREWLEASLQEIDRCE